MKDLNGIRRFIAISVYGILGIIVAIVLIRIIFKLIGANVDSVFVANLYSFSDTFVNIFNGIYPTITAGTIQIELYSVIAMLFYLASAFLVSKSITSVVEADKVKLLNNLVDSFFKIIEFLLIARFIFKITDAGFCQFTTWVYNVSAVIYEPFKGALPAITIQNPNITFETSTLIAIIVIIIFDVVTENIIRNLAESFGGDDAGSGSHESKSHSHKSEKHTEHTQTTAATPQNITINLPPQQVSQPYIDQRTVNVVHPGAGQQQTEGHEQKQITHREV